MPTLLNFIDNYPNFEEYDKFYYLYILLSFIFSNKKFLLEIADKIIIHILSNIFRSFFLYFRLGLRSFKLKTIIKKPINKDFDLYQIVFILVFIIIILSLL